MPDIQVYLTFFDDLDMAVRCLESLPDDGRLTVYAVDGRFEGFPGEYDVTPGAADAIEAVDAATDAAVVYAPAPEARRPWGSDRNLEPIYRYDQVAEAQWVNYELLDQETWTVKLDADEVVAGFEIDWFDTLAVREQYTPVVVTADDSPMYPSRVYVPGHWTFWIPDVMFPRELYPRSTPVEELAEVQFTTQHNTISHGGIFKGVKIVNYGGERPADYQDRRASHLQSMHRTARAAEYREMVKKGRWHPPGRPD